MLFCAHTRIASECMLSFYLMNVNCFFSEENVLSVIKNFALPASLDAQKRTTLWLCTAVQKEGNPFSQRTSIYPRSNIYPRIAHLSNSHQLYGRYSGNCSSQIGSKTNVTKILKSRKYFIVIQILKHSRKNGDLASQ